MVKIKDYKVHQNELGVDFCVLIVEGGIEAVRSKISGRTYLTTRTARLNCTFDEKTCQSLIGSEIPGKVLKVQVEPYEFTIEETGEIISRDFQYMYMSEEDAILHQNTLAEETVL
ncbi:hypothetical protein SAMN05444377_101238 [Flavobacterium fontis]|uniref:Uncharacterized protein n=1 Tax=Flavobacterium fontis TaxID=1124188 RepID=A0A1M4WB51_9FLAO|nr:hypothetical protein [Flavobacterium fontis]SHE78449.1 hypothetical protein SAMN05444377_101238 [Flavobacterium fontis]